MDVTRSFFIYNTTWPLFAGAGTVVNTIVIDNDYDFMAVFMNAAEIGAAPVLSNYTLGINDSYASRDWFLAPIGLQAVTGTGAFPFVMPAPRLLPRRATIRFSLTAAAAGAGPVHVGLIGYKKIGEEPAPRR